MAKKLKMSEIFSREAYNLAQEGGLTPGERRSILKYEQALEYSGWRQYPATARKLADRIPEEWWDKYSAEHIGEVMSMLQVAFSDGKAYGEERNNS